MSASSKKKLRKELNAAAMTEKQLQEQKESKKLRLYTGLFAAAIAVMILVVIVSRVFSTGMIPRRTTALTVDGTKVSAAELNHYYVDSINNFLNSYGQYAAMFGLDTTKPLDEQFYDEANGKTWADYFLDGAAESAKGMYALYNAAKAEGFEMTEASAESIESTVANFDIYAAMYGFSSADAYIAAMYGEGCNEDTFRQYAEVQLTASDYAAAHNESLVYDDAAIRAEEAENFNAYSSFSYNSYYMANSKFYEGGTEDEEGNKTYSEAEMEAGRAACEAAANSLLSATTVAELDAAIAALPINAEVEGAKSNASNGVAYGSVQAALTDWVTASERKAGDITVIPNEVASTDDEGNETTEIAGYYVVMFGSKDDNLQNLVNVRHILVSYEGGTTDANGNTTYSDKEKQAAKDKADELLASFLAGEATEEAFAALATENTTDTGSKDNGGLYENVYPGQMVTNFNNWCFDSARKAGDTAVVETEYGCHVMYFVGSSDTTYRDFMIENTLRNEAMTAWESELVDAAQVEIVSTKYVQTDLVLNTETNANS